MSKTILRAVVFLALSAVVVLSGLALFFSPADAARNGFRPCPVGCLAPCAPQAEPDVLCKTPDGVQPSTFGCCCCVDGEGNYYKPLPPGRQR